MTLRPVLALLGLPALVTAALTTVAARAQVAPYDLAGPALTVSVTRGGTTLPIAAVPNLAEGDRLSVAADLPADQSARYILVLAFLRGATNPPPKSWFFEAETWNRKKSRLSVTVPKGAEQVIAVLAPATGGDFSAVRDAVRGRPGAFVRASQDLNQASLDRARLDTYVAAINRRDAAGGARLDQVSPQLARSLAIRLKDDCLTRPPEAQAGCLTGGSDAMVLSDGHSSSIAEALTGTPTDLAYQLSATREGGLGYYSPYIGVVRDVARLLGAFRTANYQYIPALATHDGTALKLLLNAVPSFGKPKSVLVAALPPVSRPLPPPLRATKADAHYCLTRPGLVLPVEGAPLIYATRYARDLSLRVAARDGRVLDLPLIADAEKGGLILATDAIPVANFDTDLTGRIHGVWGFDPFDGPRFTLQIARAEGWRAPDGGELVTGRENMVALAGPGTACVDGMSLKLQDGSTRPVSWEDKDGLVAKLPLTGAPAGRMTLSIRLAGLADPVAIPLTAYAEAGRIDGFTLHATDSEGFLSGARLDTIAALTIDGTRFHPGALTRSGGSDRLAMIADTAPAFTAGEAKTGRATMTDGRTLPVRVTIAPPRPAATLLDLSATPATPPGLLPIALPARTVSQRDRLTFSLRSSDLTRFNADDRIEIASATARTTVPVRLQDATIAIASLSPGEALGPSAAGPLRYRVVQGDVAGDWQPLATLVRLPALTGATCTATACTVTGRDLFLIAAIGTTPVPEGYTGDSLTGPPATDGRIPLSLRDSPGLVATVAATAR